MLNWFNKQKNSSSPSEDRDAREQNSLSIQALSPEDYEFLFNQLIDGVAHGWHIGKILKFFENLEPRANPSGWVVWLKGLEQRVIYGNDPLRKRLGVITIRLGEILQLESQYQEFSDICQRIGKKLVLGDTANLIWEYDGADKIVAEEITPENTESNISLKKEDSLNSQQLEFVGEDTQDATLQQFHLEKTEEIDFDLNEISSNGSANSDEVESLDALTQQLTILQDATADLDSSENTSPNNDAKVEKSPIEQPTANSEFVEDTEESLEASENPETDQEIESLAALTDQLTLLQEENNPQEDNTPGDRDPDSEPTLEAQTENKPDPSTPLSVASFLEATKALTTQEKNGITPLTWDEFVTVLEQDETLAQQVAEHLQLATTNPQEIVKAAVDRLNVQKQTALAPDTLELVESWFDLGLKQVSAEDFQGAIASWDKALKIAPNLSEAWHNRGSALGRLGKYKAAIESFNKAIEIAPDRHQAWNDRAHALYQIQKWQQAVESWDKAIAIVSDNYQFWYNRGCALEQLQRYDESILSYEKTLEIKPDFQPARSRYISLVTERSSSAPNSLS